jgi:adenylate kinase
MLHTIMSTTVALTGTPGTGKTTLATLMGSAGWSTVDLTGLARTSGCVVGRDEERQTDEVDLDQLRGAVEGLLSDAAEGTRALLVGHMAHLLPCDVVLVLRCSPSVLEERLETRGWPPAKVRENLEAEGVGVILVEAMELEPPVPVYELDTTHGLPQTTAEQAEAVLAGAMAGMEAGWVDWSEEVMGWY